MTVLLLSRNVAIYSTRRLTEALRARGARSLVLDPFAVGLAVGTGGPTLVADGGPMPALRAAIPRIGIGVAEHALAVIRQLEIDGVPLTAGSEGILASRDKMRGVQVLAAAGLPVPATVLVRQERDVAWAVEAVGGPPVVLKFPSGTHGVGVFLAESLDAARTVLEAMWGVERTLVVQHFVKESAGRDLRLFVVAGRVAAAMRRIAETGSFRANLHHGGRAEAIATDPALADVAVRAAAAFGLTVAGVDVLEGPEGPLVTEVNSSPGLEGIEDATGVDLAGAVADAALAMAGRETER